MLAILKQLAGRDFRFTAIAPHCGRLSDALTKQSIPTVPFSVRGSDNKKRDVSALTTELQTIVRQQKLDILHANSLSMSRLVGQPKLTIPATTTRTGHLRDIVKLSKAAVSDINCNNGVIAVSHATRDFHVAQGFEPARCEVIYNGVDSSIFCRSNEANTRAELFPDIPSDAAILLNIGQICLRKNQLGLAKAICRLLHMRSDIYLVLAGERHSTKQESIEYEQGIKDEFLSIEKPHHLQMLGYRNDISKLMNAADILVHTPHQEPFGRTLLEAASCELPIIATNVGGTSEMLRDNVDAILVPPGNIDTLCSAINRVLNDTKATHERSESARKHMVTEFSIASAAEKTADFWHGQLTAASPVE